MNFRLVIAGGGTGGHFFPGLALAQAVKKYSPSADVLFVGSEKGIEAGLAPNYGFQFRGLKVSGFSNVGLAKKIKALTGVAVSFLACLSIQARFKPTVVVGVGGYASFPMALAARLCGTPLLLMEQNVEPGLSNRVLAPLAGMVITAFPQTSRFFGRKALLLGNPVRSSLASVVEEREPSSPFRILVLGGSGGSRALNEAMIRLIPVLKSFTGGIEVYHQTGPTDFDRVRTTYEKSGFPARVEPFIYDMEEAYGWCHAVLCRAGATTIAELSSVRRPAILVPFPYSAGGHQLKNARGFEDLGCGYCIEEKDIDNRTLLDVLHKLSDENTRKSMKRALAEIANPGAASSIAKMLLAGGGR